MVDWGVILGGAGLASSLVTVVYARQQVSIARRVAEDAKRTSLLASSHEMLERYQGLRTRWLTHPKGLSALRETLPGLDEAVTIAGGMDLYLLYRDMIDTFQDVYFLRQEGVVPANHWHVWSRNHMRSPLRAQGYEGTFRFAATRGLLDAEFVKFYDALFAGREPVDPYVPAAA